MTTQELHDATLNLWAVLNLATAEIAKDEGADPDRLQILIKPERLAAAVQQSREIARAMRVRQIGNESDRSCVRHMADAVAEYIAPGEGRRRPDLDYMRHKLGPYIRLRDLFDELVDVLKDEPEPVEQPTDPQLADLVAITSELTSGVAANAARQAQIFAELNSVKAEISAGCDQEASDTHDEPVTTTAAAPAPVEELTQRQLAEAVGISAESVRKAADAAGIKGTARGKTATYTRAQWLPIANAHADKLKAKAATIDKWNAFLSKNAVGQIGDKPKAKRRANPK